MALLCADAAATTARHVGCPHLRNQAPLLRQGKHTACICSNTGALPELTASNKQHLGAAATAASGSIRLLAHTPQPWLDSTPQHATRAMITNLPPGNPSCRPSLQPAQPLRAFAHSNIRVQATCGPSAQQHTHIHHALFRTSPAISPNPPPGSPQLHPQHPPYVHALNASCTALRLNTAAERPRPSRGAGATHITVWHNIAVAQWYKEL
ncbi:hypothetical protein COO60DRAFT_1537785 [Scenedesmus sp. NREL 46B-D3]|nr:hypothetical protein COO60DRAFT_1537785 [Scenedesmus sp. NREL 46B-D3]